MFCHSERVYSTLDISADMRIIEPHLRQDLKINRVSNCVKLLI